VAVIVGGAVFALLLVGLVIFCVLQRRRRRLQEPEPTAAVPAPHSNYGRSPLSTSTSANGFVNASPTKSEYDSPLRILK
jgi:hypothetical protein